MTITTIAVPKILNASQIYQHDIPKSDNSSSYEWAKETTEPFDELIISWNAVRPTVGSYDLYASVFIEGKGWSPWLLYMHWAHGSQKSFLTTVDDLPVRVYQDAVEIQDGHTATGFKVSVRAKDGADLKAFESMHICATDSKKAKDLTKPAKAPSFNLNLKGISQMRLDHPRCRHMCSPTATTAVLRYLLKSDNIDPLIFAKAIYDEGFDIYGNWVLNIAEASALLGKGWHCYAARLEGFDDILKSLEKGIPVVVSIKGPLQGGSLPYANGHLMVVQGYDADKGEVICIDPAFSTDEETIVSYDYDEFMKAWGRRRLLAYILKAVS